MARANSESPGYVLLRHRLLLEPGGFEGLRATHKAAYSDDLPLPDGPNVVDQRFHRDAAAASRREEPRYRKDVIAQIHKLLRFHPKSPKASRID